MIYIQQHAVYSCEWDEDKQSLGRVDLLCGLDSRQHTPFSPEMYSKFKYGSGTACRHYAWDVFRAFQLLFSKEFNHDVTNLVMTSSPYKAMPAASTALFAEILTLISDGRRLRNLSSLEDIKIHRKNVLKTDYSLLTQESRAKAMESTQLDIDLSVNLHGKHLVVIDDCIITGAHMNKITHHLRNSGLERISFLFILSVRSNALCQSTTAAENYLNHHHVSSLDKWLELVNAPDAGPINARMLKYFLTSEESIEKKDDILARLRHKAILEMHHGAIADEIASSFDEQMQAIERQFTANEIKVKKDQIDENNKLHHWSIGWLTLWKYLHQEPKRSSNYEVSPLRLRFLVS